MNKNELIYFEWLCDKVVKSDVDASYSKLFSILYDCIFIPSLRMDENRAEDGRGLKRRYHIETGDITPPIIRDRCSVLEMMVALAIRCEETIMTDDNYGDRTAIWFWTMIESLGLMTMDDSKFNRRYVKIVLERFIDRQYSKNGEGGLFTIERANKDMRNVEIWYQMCWYLDTLLDSTI